jgi:Na+/H+-translocating membrane pyrophosphatase
MPSTSSLLTIVIGASIGALLFAVGLARWVLARSTGTPEMRKISDAIQEGAEAYLRRQNKTIAMLAVLVAAVLAVGYGLLRTHAASDPVDDPKVFAMFITLSFLLGALSSGIAGYMGMWVSIRTNIRVAAAAMNSLNAALQTALRGGAVSGLFTVAMSLLGVGGLFAILSLFAPAGMDSAAWSQKIPFLIVGYGFGASFVAPNP